MPDAVRIGPSLAIRRLRADEWTALRSLRLRALREDPSAFGSTLAQEEGFTEERWRSRALRGAEAPDNATFVALRPNGTLAGMVVIAHESDERAVYGMWVEPEARHLGLGGRLLDAALAWPGPLGLESAVRLEVNPVQEAAVRLYLSRGFAWGEKIRPLEHRAGESVREMVRPPRERPVSG